MRVRIILFILSSFFIATLGVAAGTASVPTLQWKSMDRSLTITMKEVCLRSAKRGGPLKCVALGFELHEGKSVSTSMARYKKSDGDYIFKIKFTGPSKDNEKSEYECFPSVNKHMIDYPEKVIIKFDSYSPYDKIKYFFKISNKDTLLCSVAREPK